MGGHRAHIYNVFVGDDICGSYVLEGGFEGRFRLADKVMLSEPCMSGDRETFRRALGNIAHLDHHLYRQQHVDGYCASIALHELHHPQEKMIHALADELRCELARISRDWRSVCTPWDFTLELYLPHERAALYKKAS